mmetsp:Transcript_107862/g.315315  ORF Transcript_107862/g.315315 Transcript_107862/m.315315 type:complete len:134 (+) Transcript_107862:140-541(+)
MASVSKAPLEPGWLLGTLPSDTSHINQPVQLAQTASPPPPTITGKLMGNDVRWVRVSISGTEEEVEINGENGPAWLQSNGQRGKRVTDGIYTGYRVGQRSPKPWSSMGSTEREALLIITAKRQQRLRESKQRQ